jgi:hypothetical protein
MIESHADWLFPRSSTKMSLIENTVSDAGTDERRRSDRAFEQTSNFRFVPRELAAKARKLIESFHALHGYGCLPDLLWHSGARDLIECHRELGQIFRSASKLRCAKRANDSLLLIATVVFSVVVVSLDKEGWGRRFPMAKREADRLLGDMTQPSHAWFMDMYLYPSLGIQREVAGELASPAASDLAMERF